MPIEFIKVGDFVMSQDPITLEQRFKRVTQLHQRRANDIWLITFSQGSGSVLQEIKATAEHPFWVQGKGWVEAEAIVVGDQILTKDHLVTIERLIPTREFEQVYNFTVEDWNNYFVAESGLWVHNANEDTECPIDVESPQNNNKDDTKDDGNIKKFPITDKALKKQIQDALADK